MNEDILLKDIDDLFKKDKSSGSSFKKDFEDSHTVDSNSNVELIEKNNPKNIFEVRDALERLRELEKDSDGKDYVNRDRINEIHSFLSSGIVLDEIPFQSEFIGSIIGFLGQNGFSDEFVLTNLKDMEGHVLPVEYLYGGKAQALRSHIDLELDFFDYDEDGKVIGVSKDKEELYRHVVVHEFFHKLSSYKNGHRDIMVMGDALLEGFTDLYTRCSLGDKVESDLYGFPVKVCDLFTEMIGVDKTLDDYINHTGEFPNLRGLFSECGIKEENDGLFYYYRDIKSVGDFLAKSGDSLRTKSYNWCHKEREDMVDSL